MRLIDADAFCAFLREVSTRHHYETLLTNKDKSPTVADVIEAICCDLDGTSLNGFDNAPTVDERPQGEWIPLYPRTVGEWEYRCSNCGHRGFMYKYNFCSDCGADMRKGGAE